MDKQTTLENLKAIRKLANSNPMMFNMAVTHLFGCGTENFTEETYNAAMNSIEEKHRQAKQAGAVLFMTMEFETTLLRMAYQLSKYPLFDIFLVIKKDMIIHDPEISLEDDDSKVDSHAYTLEQVKVQQNVPAWLEIDGERTLVIIDGYEWRQGHVTEWMSFSNHSRMPLVRYVTEWVLYPYRSEM